MQCIPQEFDRSAVVTIQGGGIYGLSVLGQLSALHYQYKIEPLALAGTSAGAIVASLYGAGYSPNQIRNLFIRLAKKGEFASILGPFEPLEHSFTFDSFRAFCSRCGEYWKWGIEEFQPRKSFPFIRESRALFRGLKACLIARNVAAGVMPHVPNLGLFGGGQFLTFRVDDEADPQRITHIRGVELPEGVLYTPPDLVPQTRMLSEEAVRTVAAAFQWAEESRRDADEE